MGYSRLNYISKTLTEAVESGIIEAHIDWEHLDEGKLENDIEYTCLAFEDMINYAKHKAMQETTEILNKDKFIEKDFNTLFRHNFKNEFSKIIPLETLYSPDTLRMHEENLKTYSPRNSIKKMAYDIEVYERRHVGGRLKSAHKTYHDKLGDALKHAKMLEKEGYKAEVFPIRSKEEVFRGNAYKLEKVTTYCVDPVSYSSKVKKEVIKEVKLKIDATKKINKLYNNALNSEIYMSNDGKNVMQSFKPIEKKIEMAPETPVVQSENELAPEVAVVQPENVLAPEVPNVQENNQSEIQRQ